MSDDNKIGYGRPPKHTRFPKGRSGNPRGRPKGAKSVWAVLDKVLREKVTVREGGQRKRVSKLEASLKSLLDQAMKGNVPALTKLIELMRLHPSHQGAAAGERVVVKDETAREIFMRRIDRLAQTQAEAKAEADRDSTASEDPPGRSDQDPAGEDEGGQ